MSPSDRTNPRKLELSLAQTIGGSLAAATAAAAGSHLGVAGTITSAALVSVVASVAGALYTNSLRHTGDRVASVLQTVRGGPTTWVRPRLPARRVLAGAATVFAITAVAVTGFEMAAGMSLSGESGTTVTTSLKASTGNSSTRNDGEDPRETPAERTTPSETTSPTGSETASPSPTTSTPTPTPTGSPSATPTPQGTPTGSASATPSIVPSVSPSEPSTPVVSESVTP